MKSNYFDEKRNIENVFNGSAKRLGIDGELIKTNGISVSFFVDLLQQLEHSLDLNHSAVGLVLVRLGVELLYFGSLLLADDGRGSTLAHFFLRDDELLVERAEQERGPRRQPEIAHGQLTELAQDRLGQNVPIECILFLLLRSTRVRLGGLVTRRAHLDVAVVVVHVLIIVRVVSSLHLCCAVFVQPGHEYFLQAVN